MRIKCCYVMCKFNTAEVNLKDYTQGDELGDCACKDAVIVLGDCECEDCGNNDEGMTCENFVSKLPKLIGEL